VVWFVFFFDLSCRCSSTHFWLPRLVTSSLRRFHDRPAAS
jgi:hypothetical protein